MSNQSQASEEECLMRSETTLTKPERVMLPNMLALDDAFLASQAARPTSNNNKACVVPLHPRPRSPTETPTSWWGLLIAYLALFASLGLIFVLATMGVLNLG